MKKVIIASLSVILSIFLLDYLYYYERVIYIPETKEIECFSKSESEKLHIDNGDGFKEFQIKGVNLGLGKPGFYATEKAITKEEYLRWFKQIQDMGANVIRVYTLGPTDFYEAFYEYNINTESPLYLIHGVWVDDYLINSIYSANDDEFYEPFLKDCKVIVDVIHGRYKTNNGNLLPGNYKYDISPWVYGYILGVDWESTIVNYTNLEVDDIEQYDGKYVYTRDAEPFEIFLAKIGDAIIDYETERYKEQRVLAFSNWSTTDPYNYDTKITELFKKSANIDVEKIKSKDTFKAGFFASYHVYPYYPDYCKYMQVHEENTYFQYLKMLNVHHKIPVVISEFGVPASRGGATNDEALGRNQGNMSETQQGEALVSMYEDIIASGSSGGIVFNWQDEWYKRIWNTMADVDLDSTSYWSDYQTNVQYFGLLSFDPGKEKSICYVDGDKSDWTENDLLSKDNNCNLSMKYDEKFIYFLVEKSDFDMNNQKLYIAIDTTKKSGSGIADNFNIKMDKEADFIIEISGTENSRVLVQERYDTVTALFSSQVSTEDFFSKRFPKKNSSKFNEIYLLLQKERFFLKSDLTDTNTADDIELNFREFDVLNSVHYSVMDKYETGKLTYGNANPASKEFNSLADFCAGDGFVEIKIPWQLLNFADPTKMYIHDDYYEVYGVEYLKINHMNVGAGDGSTEIKMEKFNLTPIGKKPEYHERLKESYYILKDYWTK
ncbi:MAG: hypothetical protein E7522_05140 [Ruminococcaceae bacterium]|nr:hypothetical protein [Oscillospiraceae bacterium]